MKIKTKNCPVCKKRKLRKKFYKNSSKYDGLDWCCKLCHSELAKNYYRNESPKQRKYRNFVGRRNWIARRARNRQFIQSVRQQSKCIDCGNADFRVLDFDHVRGRKVCNVSAMIKHGRPLKIIRKEIAKCEVRCANCHRIKNYNERMKITV